jgi:hypothetical protein
MTAWIHRGTWVAVAAYLAWPGLLLGLIVAGGLAPEHVWAMPTAEAPARGIVVVWPWACALVLGGLLERRVLVRWTASIVGEPRAPRRMRALTAVAVVAVLAARLAGPAPAVAASVAAALGLLSCMILDVSPARLRADAVRAGLAWVGQLLFLGALLAALEYAALAPISLVTEALRVADPSHANVRADLLRSPLAADALRLSLPLYMAYMTAARLLGTVVIAVAAFHGAALELHAAWATMTAEPD